MGLYDLDLESPQKTRTARSSAGVYQELIKTKKIPKHPVPRVRNEFPKEFLFGSASAAYQVEGAWDVDGKGENIWDRYTHTMPNRIAGSIKNGDDAAKSYKYYKEDVKALNMSGVRSNKQFLEIFFYNLFKKC